MQPFMQYGPEDDEGVAFQWHGGEYIEIGYVDEMGFTAHDVINVWDYKAGAPRIARTLDAFQVRCDEYMAEHAEEMA